MSDSTPATQDTAAESKAEAKADQAADQANQASEATSDQDPQAPSFGWNAYAERTNGRFAMVGFVVLLVMELFTRQDFWSWIGF